MALTKQQKAIGGAVGVGAIALFFLKSKEESKGGGGTGSLVLDSLPSIGDLKSQTTNYNVKFPQPSDIIYANDSASATYSAPSKKDLAKTEYIRDSEGNIEYVRESIFSTNPQGPQSRLATPQDKLVSMLPSGGGSSTPTTTKKAESSKSSFVEKAQTIKSVQRVANISPARTIFNSIRSIFR